MRQTKQVDTNGNHRQKYDPTYTRMHRQCNAKVLVKNGTHLLLHVCARVGDVAAVLGPVRKACVHHERHIATSSGIAQPAPRHDPEQHHYQKIS